LVTSSKTRFGRCAVGESNLRGDKYNFFGEPVVAVVIRVRFLGVTFILHGEQGKLLREFAGSSDDDEEELRFDATRFSTFRLFSSPVSKIRRFTNVNFLSSPLNVDGS